MAPAPAAACWSSEGSIKSVDDENEISEPVDSGTTQLPKSELSYRWVIHDAKVFLEYNNKGVKSPTFFVTTNHHVTSWYLHVKKISVKVPVRMKVPATKRRVSQTSYGPEGSSVLVITNCLHVSLWRKEFCTSSFLSQFAFSIVNEVTGQAFCTTGTVPIVQCWSGWPLVSPSEVHKDESIEYHTVSKYLQGGRLTLQVNANLHFSAHSLEKQIPRAGLALHRGLKSLFDDSVFADVTIKCGDREFAAHKIVLASQSSEFEQMSASGLIKISDTDPNIVSEMLQYLYTGNAPNIETVAKDLLLLPTGTN